MHYNYQPLPPPHYHQICKYFTFHSGYNYGFQAFEYGKAHKGYWDGKKMLEQVMEFIDDFNFLHPHDQALFIFDWSSGHSSTQLIPSMPMIWIWSMEEQKAVKCGLLSLKISWRGLPRFQYDGVGGV